MNSMTGFGSATRETAYGRINVELRSVNNRFLELNLRMGSMFAHLESQARGVLREWLQRGKVDLYVRFDPSEQILPSVRINKVLLQSLVAQLKEIGGYGVSAESLLSVPGIILTEGEQHSNEALDKEFLNTLRDAIGALISERRREGETLRHALGNHQVAMKRLCGEVTEARADVVDKFRERLFLRIEELMSKNGATLDSGRLEQEVCLFADKADIAEECTRLAAHLDALQDAIAKDGEAVGRSLDFLSQEILREVNTMGSKCRDLEIAKRVLELKNETESLKEHLANVE